MIRLLVAPESVDVAPGEPASFVITIVSDDAFEQAASLRLVGLDPEWVAGLDQPEVLVPASGRVEVPVTVTLPPGFPAGAQLIGVEATVPGVTRPALASMQLVIASTDGVSMGLSPASFRGGRRGKFRINLINKSKQPITLHLSGRPAGPPPDPDAPKAKKPELEFKFKPQEVTLRPGERARARGVVSGRRPTIGAIRTKPMTIVAQGKSAPILADGRFSQRPLLSRRLLRVFTLFVVISMWAGALVTAVKFTTDKKTETAADASAEVEGPSGESGPSGPSGEGGEEVAPGEEGGENGLPAGATISGQVEGLSDRSNVRVDLQEVKLSSDLAQEEEASNEATTEATVVETTAAEQSKSATSKSKSSGGDKGKLSAQAEGEEPAATGPVDDQMTTVTDEEGFWAFAGLPSPANYQLTFSKSGFGVRTYIVSVDEENANVPLAVTMAAGDGTVSGTVDTADGPLGGATVTVTDGVVSFTTTTPTSGDVGSWSVGGLATPGTYLVTAERRGYGTETTSVSLGGSESRDGVDLTLVAGVGSISGRIKSGRDGVGGILVTAASEDVSRSVTTLTDEGVAGTFTIPQLPIPGSYTLTIAGEGWISQTQLVELTGNETLDDFALRSTTARISGSVSGPDGKLEAVGVTVSQDEPLVKTLTAASPAGSYDVQGLQPGTYTVTFERFGYETQTQIVELEAGDREKVDITLAATPESASVGDATVRGIVRSGTTGDPVGDVDIELGDESTTTDDNGTFVLDQLPAGTYDLELTSSSYQAMTRTVRLGVAADVTVDITMLPFGGLQGQVTDLTATPLEGVEVSVEAQDGTRAVDVEPAVTDENGEYLIPQSFPTGSYTATFSKALFGEQTRDFDVTAGSNAVADITLVELGTIAGSIQEPSSGVSGGFLPVSNAHVTITRTDVDPDQVVYGPTVVATGTFNVSGLQPGDYVVSAYETDPAESFTKTIDDLDLREVRDGGVVLVPGASEVNGEIFYLDAANNRVPIAGASISTRVVVGFNTLPVFPFISPILEDRTAGPTGADGEYSINGAVAGSVANYVVTAAGFTTRTVAITSSTLADEGDVVMTPLPRTVVGTASATPTIGGAGSITVTASIDGAALSTPPANQTFTVTNSAGTTGSYSFGGLQPGDYTVTLTASGYHTETVDVTVPAGPSTTSITASDGVMVEQTDVDLRIKQNSLAGAVLSGVLVQVSIPANPAFTPLVDTSDVNGEVQFRALEADAAGTTYRFQWSKTGYQTQTEDILLQRGDHFTGASILQRALPQFSTLTINLISNDNCPGGTPCATGSRTALADATVTGTPAAGGSVFSLVESSTTPGTYSITGLTPGDYVISASKALHESDTLAITAVVGSTPAADFVLDRYSDLTVTVYSDPTNTGGADATTLDLGTESTLLGATVTATPTSGGATLTLSSQGLGRYRADDITPGSYTLSVSAANHVARTGISVSPVAGDASVGDTNVELLKYSTLTVTVLSDSDFNDPDTASDTSLGGAATVTATPTTSGLSTLTLTRVGATDQYQVSNVPPSDYTISASFTNHATRTTSVTQVAAVAQTASLSLLKYPPAYVLVTDDTGGALTGATVSATTTSGSTVAFTEVGSGVYTTAALAPGTNTINASKTGFGQGSASLSITAGQIPDLDEPSATCTIGVDCVANAVVTLQEDATIEVNVYDTTQTIGTTELNDVEVSLRVLADSTFPTRHRYTGELAGASDDGKVTFSNLSADNDYQIRVSKAGYELEVVDIALNPGDVHTENVVLARLSSLIVTVRSDDDATVDGAGATVSGATVVATPTAGGAATVLSPSGVAGVYIAPYLPYGGAYTVSASASGHASNTASITVTVGTNQSTTILLSKYPTVSVQVNEDDGTPAAITDATVTLTPTGGAAVTVAHAGAGLYTRALTDPATYRLTVAKTGWATTSRNITTAAGTALSTVTVGLQPLRDVSLVLFSETIDTGTTELAGVTADLYDSLGDLIRSETSDDDGAVVFEDLAPGSTYTVEAAKDRWIPGSLSFSVPNASGSFQQLALASYPDIVAVVRSDDGTPAALTGATVVATPDDGGASIPLTSTGTAGEYRAVNVLPGVYSITASAPSHSSVTTADITVALGSDETTFSATPIDLPAYPTIQVTALSNNLTTGTAADDTGITTATVTATPSSGGPAITLAHTGAGVYSATLVPPSTTYAVTVTDAGHVTNTGSVSGVAGGVRSTTITLLQLPTVDVQVNDNDGGSADPVTDATVTITPTAGGTALTLSHTATGLYRRTSVPGGSYTLSVSKSGWVTQTQGITVTDGSTFTPVTVPLPPERTVTVEVFADSTAGSHVTGAVVERLNGSGAVVESHTTPGTGLAAFTGLTPGTAYSFRISADGYVTETISVTPVVGSNTTRQEAIASYPDLTVTVRSDDGTPAALSTATVLAIPAGGGPAVPVLPTATAGEYKAVDIEPGDDYTVTAAAANHLSASVTNVDIVQGTDMAVGPIDLDAFATLTVTLLSNDLTTGDATDDDPITTATVTATPSDGGPVVNLGHTAGGVYEATFVDPSTTYSIAITDSGHASDSTSLSGVAGASYSTTRTLLELPSLTATVNTNDGATVAGTTSATLTLAPTAGGASITIPHVGTPNGTYSRASIPAGSYTLTATKSGFEPASTAVTVTAGTSIPGDPFTLQLDQLASVALTAHDDTVGGAAAVGVDVDLLDSDGVPTQRIVTNGSGVATFTDLTPGATYSFTLSKAGYETKTVTQAVTAGQAATQDVALLRVSTLTVNVNEEDDADVDPDGALSGATVTATIAGGVAVNVPMVSAGVYRLSPLPPGTYSVTATATDHEPDTQAGVVIVAGDDDVVDLVLDAHPTLSITLNSSVTVGAEVLTALTNATVTAKLDGSGAGLSEYALTSQGNGLYAGAIAETGLFDIIVSAPGHTGKTINDAVTVTVGDADVTAATDRLVAVSGSVAGTVTIFGAGGVNTGVHTIATRNGVTVTDATDTIADGVYALTGLAPGVWQVTFSKDTYGPLTMSVTVPYGTASGTGATLTGIDATIAPLGTSVIGSTRGIASSQSESTGNPATALSGVVVTITAGSDTRPAQTVVSDGDGNYVFSFNDLTPDTYTFQYSKAGGDYTTESHSVTVVAGQIVTVAPVLVAVPQAVTVNAADGATNVNGVVYRFTNSSLLPAPGYVDSGPTVLGTATTAAIPPGSYSVTVQTPAAGYVEHTTGAATFTVPYVSGGAATYNEEFDTSGSASGTVVLNDDSAAGTNGDDGNAVGATVTITDGTFTGTATVASNGTWSISNIPQANDYDVTYELDGYDTETFTDFLDVDGAEALGTQILDKLASVTVTVVDDTGAAVSATTLGLFDDAAGTTRTTDDDGTASAIANGSTYTFEGLTPGAVVYAIGTKTGYLQVANATRTLQAGVNSGSEGLTVTLPRTASVDVVVNGLDATESATVTFGYTRLTVAGTASPPAFSDTVTTATQTGLPAGITITASISSAQTCAIVAGSTTPDDLDDGSFTLVANSTANTLTYSCAD